VIFVDTGFFYALASAADPDHERAIEVFESLDPKRLPDLCLTTNHVVLETIKLVKWNISQEAAVEIGERLYSEKIARIHWTTPNEEKEALTYLAKYHDQDYSPVDCISFVVMETRGIREALALDRHFTHRFIARPGPRPRE
jgi:hypothetical protein